MATFVPLTSSICGISTSTSSRVTTCICVSGCQKARATPIPSPRCRRQSEPIKSSSNITQTRMNQGRCQPVTMYLFLTTPAVTTRSSCYSINSKSFWLLRGSGLMSMANIAVSTRSGTAASCIDCCMAMVSTLWRWPGMPEPVWR